MRAIAGLRRRLSRAAVAGVLVAAGTAVASPAWAATTVKAVTIDCVGDAVVGHVGLQRPATGDVVTVRLHGRDAANAPFRLLDTVTIDAEDDVFEVAYSFTVARHLHSYRTVALTEAGRRRSATITDRTCQPPAEVPEAGLVFALPAAMGAGGALWWLRRRRASA